MKNAGGVGFLVIDTWAKWVLRYGHFCVKVVNLGPMDFQLGLPLNIKKNEGQNKFEVHISKNVAKMAIFWPKIGQDATFAPSLNEYNV